MNKLHQIIGLAAALLATTAMAGERWYRVEVILFDYPTGAHQLKSEKWPDEPGYPDIGKALTLVPSNGDKPPKNPPPMQVLPASMQDLRALTQSLGRSPDYRVLLHTAWIQPVYDKAASRPVHIQAGPLLTIDVPVQADTKTAQPASAVTGTTADPASNPSRPIPQANTHRPVSAATDTPDIPKQTEKKQVYPLDGLIRISRGRYLHVWLDMRYTRIGKYAENPATPEIDKAFFYRNVQHRRVRRKELHFIDHPAFGMLIRITRYQPMESQSGT